jgi:hypothetical protein
MLGGTLALADEAVTFAPLAGFGRTRRFALEDVEEISVVADRPPRLRITTIGGKSMTLLVLPSRNTPVWTRDTSARDQAVTEIKGRLARK